MAGIFREEAFAQRSRSFCTQILYTNSIAFRRLSFGHQFVDDRTKEVLDDSARIDLFSKRTRSDRDCRCEVS